MIVTDALETTLLAPLQPSNMQEGPVEGGE